LGTCGVFTNSCNFLASSFLLCFNRNPDKGFEKAKEQALEVVEVKVEGWSNPSRMDKKAGQANFVSYACFT